MSRVTLHRRQMFKLSIPYWVFLNESSVTSAERINEQPIGVMRGKEVSIELPPAQFDLSVKILFRMFKWQFSIGGERKVCLSAGEHLHLMITDKEGLARRSEGGSQRWWNILFDIDLILWLAKMFFELPHLGTLSMKSFPTDSLPSGWQEYCSFVTSISKLLNRNEES